MRSLTLISTRIMVALAVVSCASPPAPAPRPVSMPASKKEPVKAGILDVVERPVLDRPNGKPTDDAATIDAYVAHLRALPQRPDVSRPEEDNAAVAAKLGYRAAPGEFIMRIAVNDRGDDFAAVVMSGPDSKETLVRKRSRTPWAGTGSPTFVGNDLVVAAVEKGNVLVVRREKAVVWRRPFPSDRQRIEIDQLTSWNGHWVLEIDDDVIIDGESLKRSEYGQVFDWMLVGSEPLFFFVKDGRVGVSHRGEVLPLSYDDVLHGGCCEASGFNPLATSWGVRFHARRGATWFVVELSLPSG